MIPASRGWGTSFLADLRWAGLWCCGALLVGGLAGCRGDSRIPVHPVNGKVTVLGEAPEGALIVLYRKTPLADGGEDVRPSAKVDKNGGFQLTTFEANDGAPSGEYRATIQWNKLVKKGNDYVAGPDIVPPAYAKPETTPWVIRVTDNAVTLESLDIRK